MNIQINIIIIYDEEKKPEIVMIKSLIMLGILKLPAQIDDLFEYDGELNNKIEPTRFPRTPLIIQSFMLLLTAKENPIKRS